MKKIFLIVSMVIICYAAKSQSNSEFGIFAGCASYLGEINHSTPFYKPQLAGGILYKYNHNKRSTFRFDLFFGNIAGDDADFSNAYQQARNASFKTQIIDIGVKYEFNFLPFNKAAKFEFFSPYLVAGFTYLIAPTKTMLSFSIPVGFGIKYAPTKKISIGAEWAAHKTFSDNLDLIGDDYYVENQLIKQRSNSVNNDWYSYAGFFITVQIGKANSACPAYRN